MTEPYCKDAIVLQKKSNFQIVRIIFFKLECNAKVKVKVRSQ